MKSTLSLSATTKPMVRYAALLVITIVAFAYIVNKLVITNVVLHIRNVPYSTMLLALFSVVCSLLFSCMRYHSLMCSLGIRQPLIKSFHDNIISIIGGMVAFNIFGQGMSRTAMNARFEWAPTIAFLTTGIERASSLICLLMMALAGSIWLFNGISIDFTKSSGLALMLIYPSVVVIAVYGIGLRSQDRISCRALLRNNFYLFSKAFVFTLLILLCMGFAYVTLAWSMTKNVSPIDLFAMAAVVMLISSLPISFSGWGIRELSASHVFAVIGQSSEAGVAMGILIGCISLVAIMGLALLFVFINNHRAPKKNRPNNPPPSFPNELSASIFWFLPISVAVGILFQVLLPTDTGFVNVNLADPLVIAGALITLIYLIKGNAWRNLFRTDWLMTSLVLSSLVIAIGFLHSWIRFGVIIDWALYNRLLGWLILLSYLMTGAMIHFKSSTTGVRLIYRSYIVTCAFLVLTNIILLFISNYWGIVDKNYWIYSGIYGMAGNPNAFGFQLLIALALGFSGITLWDSRRRIGIETVLLGIVTAGVYFTQSRASLICLFCLLSIFSLLKVNTKKLLPVLTAALIVVVAFYGMIVFFDWFVDIDLLENNNSTITVKGRLSRFVHNEKITELQSDRVLSIRGGMNMWQDHLLLGAGLGAFIFEQIQKTGSPLIIHSNYLWWLAEFGILGFFAFLTIPLSILLGWMQDPMRLAPWAGHTLLAILFIMGVIGLVHDMAYQRTFWFFLGVASANPSFFSERFGSTT